MLYVKAVWYPPDVAQQWSVCERIKIDGWVIYSLPTEQCESQNQETYKFMSQEISLVLTRETATTEIINAAPSASSCFRTRSLIGGRKRLEIDKRCQSEVNRGIHVFSIGCDHLRLHTAALTPLKMAAKFVFARLEIVNLWMSIAAA